MKAQIQMACRVLRMLSSIAALSLAGCLMNGPHGYDGGAYPYSPQGSGAMIGPSGSSPYVTQPGSVYSGSTSQPPYHPSTNYPYPSSTYSTPTGSIPNTGSTIPQPTTGPFSSTPPINNSTRPVDRLPPDSNDYLDTPQRKPATNPVPNISESFEDDADFKADQGGKAVTPKSNVQDYIDELDKEGEIPGEAARKDVNVKPGAFFEDEGDEFAPPSAFNPGEETRLAEEDLDDPALFMHKDNIYRGKVRFDDVEQKWYLQYEPVADPETGEGIIYLAEYTKLSSLKNNARVVIEGSLDNRQLDPFDRPLLVIKGLTTIVPNGAK